MRLRLMFQPNEHPEPPRQTTSRIGVITLRMSVPPPAPVSTGSGGAAARTVSPAICHRRTKVPESTFLPTLRGPRRLSERFAGNWLKWGAALARRAGSVTMALLPLGRLTGAAGIID